ncbi:MAG: hypothetical protein EU530_09185 [Promethearchaeota archaeon]|nr:MAG: hypothetical protein EU530_09185 [Candidatus Lokiarchaeota archaeon]
MSKTTIQIDEAIKDRLKNLKIHPREPYSDVISRLLALYHDSKDDYLKLVQRIQERKMKELWDNEDDQIWDDL